MLNTCNMSSLLLWYPNDGNLNDLSPCSYIGYALASGSVRWFVFGIFRSLIYPVFQMRMSHCCERTREGCLIDGYKSVPHRSKHAWHLVYCLCNMMVELKFLIYKHSQDLSYLSLFLMLSHPTSTSLFHLNKIGELILTLWLSLNPHCHFRDHSIQELANIFAIFLISSGRSFMKITNRSGPRFHFVDSSSMQFHLVNSNSTSNLSIQIPNLPNQISLFSEYLHGIPTPISLYSK